MTTLGYSIARHAAIVAVAAMAVAGCSGTADRETIPGVGIVGTREDPTGIWAGPVTCEIDAPLDAPDGAVVRVRGFDVAATDPQGGTERVTDINPVDETLTVDGFGTWHISGERISYDGRTGRVVMLQDPGIIIYWKCGSEAGVSAEDAIDPPVTVSGAGIARSQPLTLAGGYTVDWEATSPTGGLCALNASLRAADGRGEPIPLVGSLFSPASGEATEITGDTAWISGLAAGSYYVDVDRPTGPGWDAADSVCNWWFTFVPSYQGTMNDRWH